MKREEFRVDFSPRPTLILRASVLSSKLATTEVFQFSLPACLSSIPDEKYNLSLAAARADAYCHFAIALIFAAGLLRIRCTAAKGERVARA